MRSMLRHTTVNSGERRRYTCSGWGILRRLRLIVSLTAACVLIGGMDATCACRRLPAALLWRRRRAAALFRFTRQRQRAHQPQHRQRHRWDAHHKRRAPAGQRMARSTIGAANYALQGGLSRRVRYDASGSGGRRRHIYRRVSAARWDVRCLAPTRRRADRRAHLRRRHCRFGSAHHRAAASTIACAGRGQRHGMEILLASMRPKRR